MGHALRWMAAPILGTVICLGCGAFGYPAELMAFTVLVSSFILPVIGGLAQRSWKVFRLAVVLGFLLVTVTWFALAIWPSFFVHK